MTQPFLIKSLLPGLEEKFPGSVMKAEEGFIIVRSNSLLDICRYLKNTPELGFDYLTCLSGVDYLDYLEVVYHLVSLVNNHSIVLKVRSYDREKAQVPSVSGIWRGAELQEREAYDLLGIEFVGHPFLKRLFLWEGFQGHPLRRDYL